MLNLSGKSALVTGATGGIGKAIVAVLVKHGAKVIMTSTKEELLKQQQQQFNCDYIVADLSNKETVSELFTTAETTIGSIDVLVCNAGVTADALVVRMNDEQWQKVLEINLTATFMLNRAAVKKMIKRRYGRIINISSVVGATGNLGQVNYVAAKSGMIGMSKTIAQEVATRGITVNCVAPGFIKTPMTAPLSEKVKAAILAKIPMGMMGNAEDIANSVLFLASNEASYITGQTLHVNGGMYM